jgi:ribose transport system permease protein
MNSGLNKGLRLIIKYNTAVIFVALLIVSACISDNFFTVVNLTNLIRQVAPIGIISMGMLLVILTAGIDLSVGSIVAMIGVLCALLTHIVPLFWAIMLSILAGVGIGCISGYLAAYQKMAPFIATLAMMTVARGIGFILSKGAPIMVADSASALTDFGNGYLLGIPNPAWIFLIVFAITYVLLRFNVLGRILIAIGSNEEAVRLSGIRVAVYLFAVYAIIGGLSAVAGIIGVSRTSVGSPIVGVGWELDAIAIVVIGGASLFGGKGTAVNTLLGVFILGLIGNIMNLMDIPSYSQQVIKGVIIILAVLLQKFEDK